MWIYIFVDVCKHLCRYEYTVYIYICIDLYVPVDMHPYIPHICVHILQVKPNAETLNLIASSKTIWNFRKIHFFQQGRASSDGSKIREVVGLHFCLVPLGRILRWRFPVGDFKFQLFFDFWSRICWKKMIPLLTSRFFLKMGGSTTNLVSLV